MEKYRSRMLEVSVKSDRPPRWEWQVTSNGEMIANGFEDGQMEARFASTNRPGSTGGPQDSFPQVADVGQPETPDSPAASWSNERGRQPEASVILKRAPSFTGLPPHSSSR